MSQMVHSRHFDRAPLTSGRPRLADILRAIRHVSKVPEAEVAPRAMGEAAALTQYFDLLGYLRSNFHSGQCVRGLRTNSSAGSELLRGSLLLVIQVSDPNRR
jgi:hypothetical protein